MSPCITHNNISSNNCTVYSILYFQIFCFLIPVLSPYVQFQVLFRLKGNYIYPLMRLSIALGSNGNLKDNLCPFIPFFNVISLPLKAILLIVCVESANRFTDFRHGSIKFCFYNSQFCHDLVLSLNIFHFFSSNSACRKYLSTFAPINNNGC